MEEQGEKYTEKLSDFLLRQQPLKEDIEPDSPEGKRFLQYLKGNTHLIWFGAEVPDGYYAQLLPDGVEPSGFPKNTLTIQRKFEGYVCTYWSYQNTNQGYSRCFAETTLSLGEENMALLSQIFEKLCSDKKPVRLKLSQSLNPGHRQLGGTGDADTELFRAIGNQLFWGGKSFSEVLAESNYLANLDRYKQAVGLGNEVNLVVSRRLMTGNYFNQLQIFCQTKHITLIDFDSQRETYFNYDIIQSLLDLGNPFYVAAADLARFALEYEHGGSYFDFDVFPREGSGHFWDKMLRMEDDDKTLSPNLLTIPVGGFYQAWGRESPELHFQATGVVHNIFYLCVAALQRYVYLQVEEELKDKGSKIYQWATSKQMSKGCSIRREFIVYFTGYAIEVLHGDTSIGKLVKHLSFSKKERKCKNNFTVELDETFKVNHDHMWIENSGEISKEGTAEMDSYFLGEIYKGIDDAFVFGLLRKYFSEQLGEFLRLYELKLPEHQSKLAEVVVISDEPSPNEAVVVEPTESTWITVLKVVLSLVVIAGFAVGGFFLFGPPAAALGVLIGVAIAIGILSTITWDDEKIVLSARPDDQGSNKYLPREEEFAGTNSALDFSHEGVLVDEKKHTQHKISPSPVTSKKEEEPTPKT